MKQGKASRIAMGEVKRKQIAVQERAERIKKNTIDNAPIAMLGLLMAAQYGAPRVAKLAVEFSRALAEELENLNEEASVLSSVSEKDSDDT
jgi:hypothetical protein